MKIGYVEFGQDCSDRGRKTKHNLNNIEDMRINFHWCDAQIAVIQWHRDYLRSHNIFILKFSYITWEKHDNVQGYNAR